GRPVQHAVGQPGQAEQPPHERHLVVGGDDRGGARGGQGGRARGHQDGGQARRGHRPDGERRGVLAQRVNRRQAGGQRTKQLVGIVQDLPRHPVAGRQYPQLRVRLARVGEQPGPAVSGRGGGALSQVTEDGGRGGG